jgi:hypothetical protein
MGILDEVLAPGYRTGCYDLQTDPGGLPMRRPIFLFLAFAFGCPADTKLSDSGETEPDDSPPVDEECTEDVECSGWQICDDRECIDGDRNNAEDEAEALIQDDDIGVDRYINTVGDADYFSFSSAGGEFIFANTDAHEEVSEGSPVPDTFLTLYAPDGSIVTTADDFPNGGTVNNMDSALWAYLSQAGVYILKVSDANPIKGEPGWGGQQFSYHLDLSSWGQATHGSSTLTEPVLFGDDGLGLTENTLYAVGVILEEPGEVDYIQLDFPYDNAGLYVDGIEDLQGSDANPQASIMTMDGTLLAGRDEVGPYGGVLHPNVGTGPLMVAVQDADGGGGTNHWAVLIIKALSEDSALTEEVEPNDADVQATVLEMTERENGSGKVYFDGMQWGEMSAPGDTDFFKIQVSGDATTENDDGDTVQYMVVCMNSARWGSSIAPNLTAYSADGTELMSSAGDADDTPDNRLENVEITPGETVYVEVSAGAESAGTPDEWYMLKAYVASFSVTSYEEGGYSCP